MKLLLRHYGIETTEISEADVAYGGPPPPPRGRTSERLPGAGLKLNAPPIASSSWQTWPNSVGLESSSGLGQVEGALGSHQGFGAALNPLQVHAHVHAYYGQIKLNIIISQTAICM